MRAATVRCGSCQPTVDFNGAAACFLSLGTPLGQLLVFVMAVNEAKKVEYTNLFMVFFLFYLLFLKKLSAYNLVLSFW